MVTAMVLRLRLELPARRGKGGRVGAVTFVKVVTLLYGRHLVNKPAKVDLPLLLPLVVALHAGGEVRHKEVGELDAREEEQHALHDVGHFGWHELIRRVVEREVDRTEDHGASAANGGAPPDLLDVTSELG